MSLSSLFQIRKKKRIDCELGENNNKLGIQSTSNNNNNNDKNDDQYIINNNISLYYPIFYSSRKVIYSNIT